MPALIGVAQSLCRWRKMLAQHVAYFFNALTALGATAARRLYFPWRANAGLSHGLLDFSVGQRIANADIHHGRPLHCESFLVAKNVVRKAPHSR